MCIIFRILILVAIDFSVKSFRNHNNFFFLWRNLLTTLNSESFATHDTNETRSGDYSYTSINQRSRSHDRITIPAGYRKSQSKPTDKERDREFQITGVLGSATRPTTVGISNNMDANATYHNNEWDSIGSDRDKEKDREFYREHSFMDVLDYRESIGSNLINIGRDRNTSLSQAVEVGLGSNGESVAGTVLSFIQSRKSYSASGSSTSRSRHGSAHGQGSSTVVVSSSEEVNLNGDLSSRTSVRSLSSFSSSASLTSAQLSSIILADNIDSDTVPVRSTKRGKDRYSTTASQLSSSSVSGSNNNMLHPHESTLTLQYDHLANDSLSAIELLPFVNKRKDSYFLLQWWVAASKHQVISERFHEIEDQARDLYIRILKTGVAQRLSNITPSSQATQRYGPGVVDAMGVPVIANYTVSPAGITAVADYVEAIEERLHQKSWISQPHSPKNVNVNTNIVSNSHINNNGYRKGKESNRESAVVAVEQYLVDSLSKFCKSHVARVICVGDVHGCVDELRDLLREVEYSPGDLVLLLGDMVAKGPSSAEVVRLAREIGSVSVRGNHDFEVIRRNAEESRDGRFSGNSNGGDRGNLRTGGSGSGSVGVGGAVGKVSDHHRIARELDTRDLEWLVQLPYMVHSPDLGSLFVHAGVLPQTELARQSPWVMMNMRSATVDGKVSPRCLHHFPWAAHWSGPLTVYFGHDAARGLQRHEHALGLDTGCVYGERLTAILLPCKEIISVPARRAYVDSRKSHSHKSLASTRADASDISELGAGAMKAPPQTAGTSPISGNAFKFNNQFGKLLQSQQGKVAGTGGMLRSTWKSGMATVNRTRGGGSTADHGPDDEFYASSNSYDDRTDELSTQEGSPTTVPVESGLANVTTSISTSGNNVIVTNSGPSIPTSIANQSASLDNQTKLNEEFRIANLDYLPMSISEQFASDSLLCEDEKEEDRMVEEGALGPAPTLDSINDDIVGEVQEIEDDRDKSLDGDAILLSELMLASEGSNDDAEVELVDMTAVASTEGESIDSDIFYVSTPQEGAKVCFDDIGGYDNCSDDGGEDGDNEQTVESTLPEEDELELHTLLQARQEGFTDDT